MNSNQDILTIIGTLAGSAAGLFALFLIFLGVLTPLMIYLIHRSTRRTAEATERIVRQNEKLIDLISTSTDFSFGAQEPPISRGASIATAAAPENQAHIVKVIADGKNSANLIGLCNCGKRFNYPKEKVGINAKCPGCKQQVLLRPEGFGEPIDTSGGGEFTKLPGRERL